MELKYKPRHHQINWVYTVEFPGRQFPLVLIDGQPSYVLNQYLYSLVEEEITPSSLEAHLTALTMMYEFTIARYGQTLDREQAKALVAEFIDARKYGTDQYCLKSIEDTRHGYLNQLGLHWKPIKDHRTTERQIQYINEFDDWQAHFHRADRMNPYETVFKSAFEIYNDFKMRSSWDALAHLHPTRQHTKKQYETTVRPKREHKRKRQQQNRKSVKLDRGFPLKRFVELVESARNPRDKMLWLLCGGGSLRGSEPLHLLFSDIEGLDELGQARVRLADPEYGMIEWDDPITGAHRNGTRTEYFAQVWQNAVLPAGHKLKNLQPRIKYGKRNSGLFVGWKGMTFEESDGGNVLGCPDGRDYDAYHVWWIDPRIGAYFYQCYLDYMNEYIYRNPFTGKPNPLGWPYHPWLLINIDKQNYGSPMSVSALKGAWSRLIERMGLEGRGLGKHSLRHMYGYYCANVLRLSQQLTKSLMHHGDVGSTGTYYHLLKSTIQGEITQGVLEASKIDADLTLLIKPNTPKVNYPEHWTNEAFSLAMAKAKLLQEMKGQGVS